MRVELPSRNWQPRPHQKRLWRYLEHGGRRAAAFWHRRSGKDEVALQYTCMQMHRRKGNYWHMLPEANQVRKAIWEAINPNTGMRRIDEAFPKELRAVTREHEMFIGLKCGSTWQALGSDNYDSLVGSPPVGVTYSEWALADPRAWAYLRPILLENDGWALFLTTPRGRNHAYKLLKLAQQEDAWFWEVLSNDDTHLFSDEQMRSELREYITEWGEEDGRALFDQEYKCSFDAALVGSYYGALIGRLEKDGRITKVPHDPALPVYTAWDLGFSDDCVIWFFQLARGEIRVIDYFATNGVGPDKMAEALKGRRIEVTARDLETGAVKSFELREAIEAHEHRIAYRYATHWLPHDARPKTFAANGRSALDQFEEFKIGDIQIVPSLSVQDGVQAARKTLPLCWFDAKRCEQGVDALRQHRRKRDEVLRVFSDQPIADWTIHASDAYRMLAIAWHNIIRAPKLPAREQYVQAIEKAQRPMTYDEAVRIADRSHQRKRARV